MKRKRGDRKEWQRVLRPQFEVKEIAGGVVTRLFVPQVLEPLWVTCCGEKVRIVDDGYTWLTFYPRGAHHILTTQFDADAQPVQWYVDIVDAHGMDEDGVPWHDDLYLDVVASPRGWVELLDADELVEALAAGAVIREQHDLAWREAESVLAQVRAGTFAPQLDSARHLALFGRTSV